MEGCSRYMTRLFTRGLCFLEKVMKIQKLSSIRIRTKFTISHEVTFFVGLYQFLALNLQSRKQAFIGKIAGSRFLCVALSFLIAALGLFPTALLRLVLLTFLGKSGSPTAVEATCSHLLKYHTMMNVLYMAKTEFQKIGKQVPDAALSIEREGHMRTFFLTEAGSLWVAEHVARLIKNKASL